MEASHSAEQALGRRWEAKPAHPTNPEPVRLSCRFLAIVHDAHNFTTLVCISRFPGFWSSSSQVPVQVLATFIIHDLRVQLPATSVARLSIATCTSILESGPLWICRRPQLPGTWLGPCVCQLLCCTEDAEGLELLHLRQHCSILCQQHLKHCYYRGMYFPTGDLLQT